MKIAICQPTYLPWLGYFDVMDQVDTFVLLDFLILTIRNWRTYSMPRRRACLPT